MYQPLADLLRPTTLDDVFGQEHILGEGAILRRLIDSGNVPNMVFYGPSGTGKTLSALIEFLLFSILFAPDIIISLNILPVNIIIAQSP